MSKQFIFSSESVGEGHPDKVCDTISDYVLDACLEQDGGAGWPASATPRATWWWWGRDHVEGEGGLRSRGAGGDPRHRLRPRGRRVPRGQGLRPEHRDAAVAGHCPGVDARAAEGKKKAEQGRGPGAHVRYACNETPELMPAPIMFAHRLGRETDPHPQGRQVEWLRPDAKSQVSVEYVDGRPRASPTWWCPRSTRRR